MTTAVKATAVQRLASGGRVVVEAVGGPGHGRSRTVAVSEAAFASAEAMLSAVRQGCRAEGMGDVLLVEAPALFGWETQARVPAGSGRESGEWAPAGGGGGGAATKPAPQQQTFKPRRPPRGLTKRLGRADRYRSLARRRRCIAALRNEESLSRETSSVNLPDSEPADCVLLVNNRTGEFVTDLESVRSHLRIREDAIKRLKTLPSDGPAAGMIRDWLGAHTLHFWEVKTLLVSPKSEVHMSGPALKRKRRWEERYGGGEFGAKFSTVILDDRRGAKFSGHRTYHFDGLKGTIHLHEARRVDGFGAILDSALRGGR